MSKHNEERIPCLRCKKYTNHEVLCSESKSYRGDTRRDMHIDFANGTWEILMCSGCDEVTFRETWATSEDLEPTVYLYPPRCEDSLLPKSLFNVPEVLRRIYREVIECYNARIDTLCAAGLRALIESICEQHSQHGRARTLRRSKLQDKINAMAKAGLLTESHAETLHEHRLLGNEALHELQAPTPEELKLAIEILEHTLENLYELPDKTTRLQRMRRRRSSPGP